MTAEQLTNYLLIALIVVIAIGRGVEVALDFYIKKMQVMKKWLKLNVMMDQNV